MPRMKRGTCLLHRFKYQQPLIRQESTAFYLFRELSRLSVSSKSEELEGVGFGDVDD